MNYKSNDGGRKEAGYKGIAGDCATRAIAIALEKSYEEVYKGLSKLSKEMGIRNSSGGYTVRNGTNKKLIKEYMKRQGWKWNPTMRIGSGCKVHLKAGELPNGRLVVQVSKHMVAVINGVINDNHNPSRDGTRCVYGYYTKE